MKKQTRQKKGDPSATREKLARLTRATQRLQAELAERRRAELALKQSEERWRFSLDAANVGTWEWNPTSGEVRWSENMEKIHGQLPGSFGGTFESFLRGVHPDDRDGVLKAINQTLTNGGAYRVEYRQIAADKSLRWMEGKGRVIHDEAGRPLRMMGICMDITANKRASQALQSAYADAGEQVRLQTATLRATNEALELEIAERKRTERALRDTEQRLHAILDSSPSVIFLKDTQGRYLYVNPQFQKLCNMTKGQIIGKTDSEIFLPAQADVFRANDLKVLQAQAAIEFEEVALHEDGFHTSIVTKFPLRDSKGRVHAICGIVTDITARKRAEEEVNRRNSRLLSLIENSPLGIVVLDAEGRIEMCNGAFERLFLYRGTETKGLPLHHVISTPEMQSEWKRVAQRVAQGETVHLTARCRRKDGVAVDVEIYRVPLMEGGSFRGSYGLFQDVTERNRFEEALRGSEESLRHLSARLLQSQDEERRRLARDLHDDFNQKLAMLAVEAESLELDQAALTPAVRQRLRTLKHGVIQLSDDVRRTAYQLHPSSLEHLGLVTSLKSLCSNFMTQEPIRLRFEHTSVPESVPPDVALCLYRIAQEALHNVARHARAKSVGVSLSGNGNGLRLVIDDDGVGLKRRAPARQPGLGITSMEERARLVGGTASVVSRPRGGTRVEVLVPVPPSEETAKKQDSRN